MVAESVGPLLVVVGETASGKSALAMELAQKFNGEIICADSRTVYKGMDIGTAKPTTEDRRKIPHHLLDVASPDEKFSVADFKKLAEAAVADITSRRKLPMLVGGTGLYIDSVLFNYQFSRDGAERDETNPRHLRNADQSDRQNIRPDVLVIGLKIDRDELKARIAERVRRMLAAGLEDEARGLAKRYGWHTSPLQTIGYQEFEALFNGEQNLDETKSAIIRGTLAYARRQRTWFKRNKHIRYISNLAEAVELTTTWLHN